jgi:hypothetical protein
MVRAVRRKLDFVKHFQGPWEIAEFCDGSSLIKIGIMSNLINGGNPGAILVWKMTMVATQSSVRWCKECDTERRTRKKMRLPADEEHKRDSHRRRVVQERGYILNKIESLGDE